MKIVVIVTNSDEETIAVGEGLGRIVRPGDFIAMHGELGAGKTRFVRGVARGMGVGESKVNSPTFVLVNVYTNDRGSSLVHMDAYRIGGANELPGLGWDRLANGLNVVIVEWAERIEEAIPERRIEVRLEHSGVTQRRITMELSDEYTLPGAARCPVCGGEKPAGKSGVFCSDRCRMADLGRWFSGDYTISRPLTERDLEGE